MENSQQRLTDLDKMDALLKMGTYCVSHSLPLPQSFACFMPYRMEGSTTLWEFEAQIEFISGEAEADRDERRRLWLRDWIRDIVRKATGTGVQISKEWDTYFSVFLSNEEEHWRIMYAVKRDVVCEKVVTGKKVVEARTIPQHEEEEIEWVCNDKSLLND